MSCRLRSEPFPSSDGNIYPILDAIVATGPDGLNPIEPVAGMTQRAAAAHGSASSATSTPASC